MCRTCLLGTERCPSCQRRFADTDLDAAVVPSSARAGHLPAKAAPTKTSGWAIAAMVAVALFGLRVVRSAIRNSEPAVPLPTVRQVEDDVALLELVERTRALAEATPTRFAGPGGAACVGAPMPQPASLQEGDDLSHALALHLSTAGQGAAVVLLPSVPFEQPPPMAFPPDEQLQLTVLAWRDPTASRGGSVRAVTSLRDRSTGVVRCRSELELDMGSAPPPASIDAARFDLLWTALQRGASQLHAVP